MKILIDLQACQTPGSRNRGIGRYSMSLAKAMVRVGAEHEFWLLLNSRFADTIKTVTDAFEGLIPPERIVLFTPPVAAQELASPAAWRMRAGELIRDAVIKSIKPDVVHVSSLFEGLTDECVVSIPSRTPELTVAVTLYDLIPLRYPSKYLGDERVKRYYMRKLESLSRADVLLGISGHSTNEALELVPALSEARAVNISSAIEEEFEHQATQTCVSTNAFQNRGISRQFVLYTGGIDWRKNIEGLIEAYSMLPGTVKAAHQLVLVCQIEAHTEKLLKALCNSLGLGPMDVVFTGYVSDQELVSLYKSCRLFVFPSLHEGFGLPVLEAMKCGAVVIGSNTSSIPEVIGNPDALFDPTNVADIATLMETALSDERFRRTLQDHSTQQAAKFSWRETAVRALAAISEAHLCKQLAQAKFPPVTKRQRPSLAMVTPMPPDRSGIADYSADLLEVLAEHYDITVIWNPTSPQPETPHVEKIRSVSWFRSNARTFDRIVYQFGNSEFHAHMFSLLRDFPGTVVLHDFFLSGVLNWMESTAYFPAAFENALVRSHGREGVEFERSHGRWKAIAAYPCNRWVVERADGVIVHSEYSRKLADSFYGKGFSRDWQTIPLLRPTPPRNVRDDARALLGLAEDDLLICSFGHLAEGKLNHRLLGAWRASSLSKDPKCRLIFVGANDPGPYGSVISREISKSPMQGQIEITGFTLPDHFSMYLAATDIAVQLRTISRGETSKAVLDCLAHGVPVVLNANGAMAEYPDVAVRKLPDDFTDAELVAALESLKLNAMERHRLGEAGLELVATRHSPRGVALQYKNAIETLGRTNPRRGYWNLISSIAELPAPNNAADSVEAAIAIAANEKLL